MMTQQVLAFASILLLVSCSGEETMMPPTGDNPLEEELCEHMIEGPAVMHSASADPSSGPDISAEHTRADITLTSSTGWVTFEADAIGAFAFALNRDVRLRVTSAQTMLLVSPTSSVNGSEICSEVVKQYFYDLSIGTYRLELGPDTGTTPIGIVSANVQEATLSSHSGELTSHPSGGDGK